MIMTPERPMAFFTRSDAEITVSVASANILPMTGTKFPVMYLAARMVTPSVTELVMPRTEMTPRNTVSSTPSSPAPILRSRLASCVSLYFSDMALTRCSTAEKNSSGNTIVWMSVPTV
ncbi:hypothetical protein D3C73_925920 [compost metagenome]